MNALLNIPNHTKCKNCGGCCGPVPANGDEIKAIKGFINKHNEVLKIISWKRDTLDCPFRDKEKNRCAIYPVRPLMCRLFGVVASMECEYGNSNDIDGKRYLENYSTNGTTLLSCVDWR